MDIVYEDSDILLVVKPAGTPTQADKTGDEDMLSMVCRQVCGRAGGAYLAHRLDRPVGGLLLFAKNERACAKLSADFASGNVDKTYLAVVCGQAGESGALRHFLLKNQRLNLSRAVREGTAGAKEAVLSYTKLGEAKHSEYGALCLLEVAPQTGRHHQIRAQFSADGLPLWGDTKYNAAFAKPKEFVHVALWARGLGFKHPGSGEALLFGANPPEDRFPFSLFSAVISG